MKNMYTTKIGAFAFFCFLALFSHNGFAQVGINTTNPDADAVLDVTSTAANTGGLLLPRVALTGTGSPAPLSADVAGMVVYNIATAGNVTPGYYYNNGTDWVRIAAASVPSDDWTTTGNAGTTAGTNFLGTSDNVALELFSNNTSRMRVEEDGQVSIGFGANPVNAGQQFNAVSNYVDGTGIGGYSGGAGTGVYGQNIDTGEGVYGLNGGTGAGIRGESFYGTGISVYALDGPIFSDNTLFGSDAVFGQTNNAVTNGIWGVNEDADGTAILGGNNSLSIFPSSGAGVAGSGTQMGVFGYAGAGSVSTANRGNAAGDFTLDTDSDPTTNETNNGTRASARLASFDNISPDGVLGAQNSYFGGYFSGGNENNGTRSYAYAGLKWNANNNGIGGTNYKIIGNGTNSTLINDGNGTPRIMFSPEAPEILFQDYGVGKLNNGVARINIDPILKKSLYVDNEHPLKVFVTLEGDCNGVFVTDKSIDGFTVKELQNGTSNVSFSWQIVANRADDKNSNGVVTSKHVGLRLPIGPGPLPSTEISIKKKDKRYEVISNNQNISSRKNKSEEKLNEKELSKINKSIFVTDKNKSKSVSNKTKTVAPSKN